MILVLSLLAQTPPAPPGASWIRVDRVYAPFTAVGTAAEFTPVRRQSISTVFSTFTGIATTDILTSVSNVSNGVSILVDHSVPSGTTGASVASSLNNGIMRSTDVLQAALQNTGGTIVTSVSSVAIGPSYEVVYPPTDAGPPLSETLIIVIVVCSVLGIVALIGLARYCDAELLRETTRLIMGIARAVTGGGVAKEDDDKKKTINVVVRTDDKKEAAPIKKSKQDGVDDAVNGAKRVAKGVTMIKTLLSDGDGDVSKKNPDTKRSAQIGSGTLRSKIPTRVPNLTSQK